MLGAVMPLVASAKEGMAAEVASRALPTAGSMGTLLLTIGVLAAFFAVITIGYTYRRERHLDWAFQKPDVPHDDHGHH